MKIAIIGFSGAGKSTLAKTLGSYFNITPLHLDTINFTKDWVEKDLGFFQARLNQELSLPNWIIDGNYFYKDQQRFEDCDLIIFLNFNRIKCFWGTYSRYLKHRHKPRDCRPSDCLEKYDWSFFKWVVFGGRRPKRVKMIKAVLDKYPDKSYTFTNRRQLNKFLLKFESTINNQ